MICTSIRLINICNKNTDHNGTDNGTDKIWIIISEISTSFIIIMTFAFLHKLYTKSYTNQKAPDTKCIFISHCIQNPTRNKSTRPKVHIHKSLNDTELIYSSIIFTQVGYPRVIPIRELNIRKHMSWKTLFMCQPISQHEEKQVTAIRRLIGVITLLSSVQI